MPKARIPVQRTMNIEEFSSGVVVSADTIMRNGVLDEYADSTNFATQRPGFNIRDDASVATTDAIGRGIYFWQEVGETYFVNDDTVYKGGYTTPLAALLSSGNDRVYFAEVGIHLVIIDPENNQAWTISSAASTTLVEITDVDFPPKQTPALSLARGGVSLNGTLYVMDTNGTIWNSGVDDPTTWIATDFIDAELENDGGVYLGLHHSNIVAVGTKTIQFFFDAANPVASPLQVRGDINYRIGGVKMDVYAETQNYLFFLGNTDGGHTGVYVLNQFNMISIGSVSLNALLSSAIFVDGLVCFGGAISMGDSVYYALTTSISGSPKTPQETFVYSLKFQNWGIWALQHPGYSQFDVVSWSSGKAVSSSSGQGMTNIGDILTISDDFNPQDVLLAQVYVLTDYVVAGYISDTGQAGDVINFEIQFGKSDYGVRENKRFHTAQLIADATPTVGTVNLSWADENNATFGAARALETSMTESQTNRLGKARRRNFKVSHALDKQYRISGIELEVTGTAS